MISPPMAWRLGPFRILGLDYAPGPMLCAHVSQQGVFITASERPLDYSRHCCREHDVAIGRRGCHGSSNDTYGGNHPFSATVCGCVIVCTQYVYIYIYRVVCSVVRRRKTCSNFKASRHKPKPEAKPYPSST